MDGWLDAVPQVLTWQLELHNIGTLPITAVHVQATNQRGACACSPLPGALQDGCSQRQRAATARAARVGLCTLPLRWR